MCDRSPQVYMVKEVEIKLSLDELADELNDNLSFNSLVSLLDKIIEKHETPLTRRLELFRRMWLQLEEHPDLWLEGQYRLLKSDGSVVDHSDILLD